MTQTSPYFREAGSGPGVVCLHSNASSSTQWRGLMEELSKTHHVLAPDSYGSGKSPEWQSDREIRLRDEVSFIESVLALAGSPFSLVGHSYGAAIALIAALARALATWHPLLIQSSSMLRSPGFSARLNPLYLLI